MLSHDDRLRYHQQGFLGPLPLALPLDASPGDLLGRIAPIVDAGSDITGHGTYARHLDSRPIFDLCTDPAVVEAVRLVLGDDLLLWNSSFWIKRDDAPPTPWHQDVHYWPAPLTVTAWIALTDTDESSGCLILIPGSHLGILALAPAPPGALFEFETDNSQVPADEAVAVPAKAGEFILLSDRMLHRSAAQVDTERWGLAARFTVPFVYLPPDRLPLWAGHFSVLVSGVDRFGLNRTGPAPL